MQIAITGAGYSAGEADQLRRDMAAWKKHGRLERHRPRLLSGFSERGIPSGFGEQLYQQIQGFGEYGFPESHSASFALIVYSSAWLKVHHPAAFACALLNSQPMGFYSPSSIVQDAQRHGVEVRPICVVASGWDHSLERNDAGEIVLRLGMRLVRGLGENVARAIEAARAERPLESVTDLVHRASLHKDDIEALAEAGALATLVPERREALWRARAPRVRGLFDGAAIEPERDVGLPKLSSMEQLLLDYGRTGLCIDDHPMKHLRASLSSRRERVLRAVDLLGKKHGQSVVVAGLVIGRQRPATASGVTFVTLEDETGVVNLVLRKDIFAAQYAVARHAKIVVARGRLEREGEVIHVLVKNLERLDLPRGVALDARSRDFH
jgi:error-prone DNA polymerase